MRFAVLVTLALGLLSAIPRWTPQGQSSISPQQGAHVMEGQFPTPPRF